MTHDERIDELERLASTHEELLSWIVDLLHTTNKKLDDIIGGPNEFRHMSGM